MDETLVRAAQDDLRDWGIVEEGPPLQPTRRFRAAMMRAAASLQAEEKEGKKRAGHPIEVTVIEALRQHPLPPGAQLRREHELFVVALQLASLPDAVLALLEE